ncbi:MULTISPECIES: hypothetical protein [unclassified Streptomyces]|uniref:hypothetical protein n=1 Tax=unclassified Streptomyces TaxID=2593676 RepID=UPI0033E5F16B
MRRTVLERFPAGGPRGSWPAEEFARDRRDEGVPAEVVMDLETDTFLVVVRQYTPEPAH